MSCPYNGPDLRLFQAGLGSPERNAQQPGMRQGSKNSSWSNFPAQPGYSDSKPACAIPLASTAGILPPVRHAN
jgi:hypothetical protein